MSSELSVKMAGWLAHVRAASEQGLSMKEYAVAQGLSASALYQAKSQLMRVGAWPRSSASTVGASRSKRKVSASRFVPVRMVDASCRLSHVSGWTLTCANLPSAAWLLSLVQGHADVAS